jgi:hypothetical protein
MSEPLSTLRNGDGLRQRFVHYSHTAHRTAIMDIGVFTNPSLPLRCNPLQIQ